MLESDSSVTFGYVSLAGIPAGTSVATLTFMAVDPADADVTIERREINNGEQICFHANTEVKGAKDASCEEDGYTGDVCCADCGTVITQGQVIPATGHTPGSGKVCADCGIPCGYSGYTIWSLSDDGVLTFVPDEDISGDKHNMRNYWKVDGVLTLPWSEYADRITAVVIEDGVTAVGQMAFYGLENLKSVTIAGSVTEIRNYAFKNCTALTSVTLNEGLEAIREGAFYGCTALETIQIPASVSTIEDWAFSKVPGYQG